MSDDNPQLGPPKGFRKPIPMSVKGDALIRQGGRCARCQESLGEWINTQFDHNPALWRRAWNPKAEDTFPPANSPMHIEALHVDCHKIKTFGRRGESKLSVGGGDLQEIAKTRRLDAKRQEAFRAQLLSMDEVGEEDFDKPKVKRPWPKRPFPSKDKSHGKTKA